RQREAVNMFVDGQAAIKSMQSSGVCSKNVMASREALDTLSTTTSVRIYWVPSHQGIDGNETANELAMEGVGLASNRTKNVPVFLRMFHSGLECAPLMASLEEASKRTPGQLLAFAKCASILKDFE
ncbi:hypothetical protein KR032_011892, partial [Drosophila birchii]